MVGRKEMEESLETYCIRVHFTRNSFNWSKVVQIPIQYLVKYQCPHMQAILKQALMHYILTLIFHKVW